MTQAVPATGWIEEKGSLVRIRLARPKANIIDSAMMRALDLHFTEHTANSGVKAVILDAEGPNFSFGASVDEHMPGKCGEMLASFHALLLKVLACPVPVIAVVQGQCLGGGLELALAANLIFAGKDAKLGQPEIKLGVFAPAASCLLPERIGRARANELLFSGCTIDAEEALDLAVINRVAADSTGAALDWFKEYLAPLSASSIRYAVRASRGDLVERMEKALEDVERLYLNELMSTRDAVEGLEAFVAKRPAKWENS